MLKLRRVTSHQSPHASAKLHKVSLGAFQYDLIIGNKIWINLIILSYEVGLYYHFKIMEILLGVEIITGAYLVFNIFVFGFPGILWDPMGIG